MLGADVGTSADGGRVLVRPVVALAAPDLRRRGDLHLAPEQRPSGAIGRVLIGLGLITLALQLIVAATAAADRVAGGAGAAASRCRTRCCSTSSSAPLLTVLSYSSLAIVLLIATLAAQAMIPQTVALGLVLGANIGSGVLAMLADRQRIAAGAAAAARQPHLQVRSGALLFIAVPAAGARAAAAARARTCTSRWSRSTSRFNVVAGDRSSSASPAWSARSVDRWLRDPPSAAPERPRHLDPLALATPSLAISCAAREALHQADVVETMLRGIVPVIRNNDLRLSEELRKLDDMVDELYSAIKFYLTQISGEALSKEESRRWTDIVSFTINMEQIGDIIERVLQDIEDKKIKKNRSFSEAGMAEIVHLHERLLANLRLAMSVFLDGHVRDAKRLLEEKAHFRDLEHEYAANHIARLRDNTAQSIETSSLHLDLISDLKRINSHICASPTRSSSRPAR